MNVPGTMHGRVVVVTGATSGIGFETARGIAARGAQVVVVGRGEERAKAVAASIASATGNPSVTAIGVEDLATRAEWVRLAARLQENYPAIHVLVNNAGAYFARREMTTDGLERTFALNVLTPLALTTLLEGRLRSSAPARVVNVASAAHGGNIVDLQDLQGARSYRGYRAYGRSKLELILLTRELARQLAGSGVTVNALHPGFIRSGFGQNNGGAAAFFVRLAMVLGAKSLKRGAATSIRLACDGDIETVTGQYFVDGKVAPGSVASQDMGMARRLYEASLPYLQPPTSPGTGGPSRPSPLSGSPSA
jgi:NAD(P)-dependent dehydrogenase (short-subunit alcohol dehydrogenase family)